ncbi:MAG TPA: hypothetical protein VM536_09165 [Chloroflexia bacterium]|nr:hypothetical protein [Chloroflexia bacterium]
MDLLESCSSTNGLRGTLARGGLLLLAGWLGLLALLFTRSLWVEPSFVPGLAPGVYEAISSLFPATWINAPRLEGWGRIAASALYMALAAGLWVAYTRTVRRAGAAREEAPGGPVLRHIMAGTALFGMLTLAWPGLFTADIYLYAAQAKMQVAYGMNPLIQPPHMPANDPVMVLLPWRDLLSAYGPVWLSVAWAVGQAVEWTGSGLVGYVQAFRGLNLLLLLIAVALFWAITGRLAWALSRRTAAAVLIAWCPLVILEMVGSGHNDMLLMLLLLAAVWLHLRGAWPLAVAALMLAGLVKLPGYFFLPAYVVLLARTAGGRVPATRRVAVSGGVAAIVAILAYWPYAGAALPSVILANPMTGFAVNSLGMALRATLVELQLALRGWLTPASLSARDALEAVRWPVWYGPLAAWAVVAGALSLRVRDFAGLLRVWALIMFSYLLFAAAWFQPWYVVWLLPVVALRPAGRLCQATLWLTLGCLLYYGVFPPFPGDTASPFWFQFYVPAVIFGPVLLYSAGLAWRAVQGHQVTSFRPTAIGAREITRPRIARNP